MTTPSNVPARAATAPELVKYRANGQAARYGLVIQHPATVYTARVNQTFDTLDQLVEITYDGGSGTLANVKEGMTMLIGSTAGARDRGEVRIRKTPSGTKFYIGETSDLLQLSDNDYLTVIDAFFFHPRRLVNKGGVVKMDNDIEFGDLTRGGFINRLGPVAAVIEQASGTITFTPPNPSLSAAYDGAVLSSLAFSAPGALTTSNMTSATTASWTYPLTADGEYRWSCAITDDLGRVTTSYRRVFVNPSRYDFEVSNPVGDFDSAGWSFEVTVLDDPGTIYDHALVTLYTRDYHGGTLDNIGKISGYTNVIACGWIDGTSIAQDIETGEVTFTVQGPGYWMEKMQMDGIDLMDAFIEAVSWNEIQEMTIDAALSRLLYWTTTLPLFMDCFLTGDTQRVRLLPIASGTLMSQVNAVGGKIFAKALCNSYGQLFIEVDPQIADSAARAAFPVVMDITAADFEPPMELEYNQTDKTARVQLSALQAADGVTDIFIHARAPGNSYNPLGQVSTYEDHIVLDDAECRRIAGALFAIENNRFEPLTLRLPSSIRLWDIAPRMIATITSDPDQNPLGVALTAQRLIPRRVEYIMEDDAPGVDVTFEIEIDGTDGIDYFPPTSEDENLDDGFDSGFDGLDFPGLDGLFPETVPPEVTNPCSRDIGNYFTLNWRPRTLTGSTSTRISYAYFPCMIRASSSLNPTYIQIQYTTLGDADNHKACYAVNNGTRVLTGTWTGNVISFSPISDTEITGFEIELDAGAGASIATFVIGDFLELGEMGVATTMTVQNKYYAIEAYTGYWTATFPPAVVGLNFYNTMRDAQNIDYDDGAGRDGFGDFHFNPGTSLLVGYGNDYAEEWDTNTSSFQVSGNYGRIYFQAGVNQSIMLAASTGALGVEYHDMKWALYEAQAIGRQLTIGASTLHNVCAVEA